MGASTGAIVDILVIDDDAALLAGPWCRWLSRTEPSWTSHWVEAPEAGIEAARTGRYKVVVVDVRFPYGPSGFDVVRTLRGLGCAARIITFTGKSDTVDELDLSAAAGADAHVLKEAGPDELRRQIRFALARPSKELVLRCDELDLEFDLVTERATVLGNSMTLTPLRWNFLRRLARSSPDLVSHQDLWDSAGVDAAQRHAKDLNTHMRALEAELDERSGRTGPVIRTVWGVGYALVPRERAQKESRGNASATNPALPDRFSPSRRTWIEGRLDQPPFTSRLVEVLAPVRAALERRGTEASSVDDAVQEAALVLVRRCDELQRRSLEDLCRYALRAAENWLSNARREAARRLLREEAWTIEHAGGARNAGHPDELFARAEAARALLRSLECLPPELREVVVACNVDGLSAPPAAERLGIPEGTVKSRLIRAHSMLQRLLAEPEGTGRTASFSPRKAAPRALEADVRADRRNAAAHDAPEPQEIAPVYRKR